MPKKKCAYKIFDMPLTRKQQTAGQWRQWWKNYEIHSFSAIEIDIRKE